MNGDAAYQVVALHAFSNQGEYSYRRDPLRA